MRIVNAIVFVLVFVLVMVLGGSVFAAPGSVVYRKYYDIDGIILMKVQSGSEYSESGFHKTLVKGTGSLEREEFISMSIAGLNIFNDSSWIADPGSLRGLEVASAFNLNGLWSNPEDFGEEGDSMPEAHQVFAVSVKAGSGESGMLSQNISADAPSNNGESGTFAIDQYAATSDGMVKRFVDLIEPVTGFYIFEDSTIKGKAEIYDSLYPTGENEVTEAEDQFDSAGISSEISGFEEKDAGYSDQTVIVLEDDEYFTLAVPLGTPVEDIGLPETLDLEYGLTVINDITIEWDIRDLENYDSEIEGSYMFFGKLIFPESVSISQEFYVCFSVEVI